MKKFILYTSMALFTFSCGETSTRKPIDSIEKKTTIKEPIKKEEALEIARADAQSAYKDLSIYSVKAELVDGNWKVDYELTDTTLEGGGPHYIISAETGEIISRKYQQ